MSRRASCGSRCSAPAPGRSFAHIPGWQRDPRCEVVALCDVEMRARARLCAASSASPRRPTTGRRVVGAPDIDVVDVVTPSHTHFELAWAALEAGKHVLCEKPVAYDFRETRAAAELARSKGLKTKLGFTFRYSPGVQYAKSLIDEGFVGTPFIFNGYEQNSQWLDPQEPLRQVDPDADQSVLQTSSLEGYGAPIIDIGHWWVGADYTRVVGTMRNFIPERMVRATGRMMRMNIDDGDIFIGEYANGAIGSIQTSFVTDRQLPRHRGAHLRRATAPSSAAWSRSSASPKRSRSPRPTRSSSRRWRFRSASIRRAAARANRGARCSTPT